MSMRTIFKDNIEFTALFYQLSENSTDTYRKYAHIKKRDCEVNDQDLTLIMLNPGSCKNTLKDIPLNKQSEQKVIPDATMHRVKNLFNFSQSMSFIRTLNLSDYCEKRSNDFLERLSNNELPQKHSIFHQDRMYELERLIRPRASILLACGVDSRTTILLNQAKSSIEELGGTILNSVSRPYHPLVRKTDKTPKWIDQVKDFVILK